MREPPDLRTLSRDGAAPGLTRGSGAVQSIPPPRFNWKTRIALPVGLLAAVVLLLGYTARDALLPATAVRVVPVVVKSTAESAAASVVQAPGWVEADPYPIAVSALTDGVVKEVFVLEGEAVKAGDVVVKLVDDDARLELARAEADLAQQQAMLDAAQRHWDHPIERDRAVAAAEGMVAEIRAELVRNQAETVAEAARADEIEARVRRARQAFEHNAATELEVIEAELQHQAQQAVLEAARARKPVLEAQLAQRLAELEAARRHRALRIEETQALATAKAALNAAGVRRDEARLRLERTHVRSPADGIVMTRFAEPGTKLVIGMDDPRSAHAVRLYDPQRLQVRVDVPLADAAKVGAGQAAKIVVGVLPDKTFDGKVTRIVNEADVQKNTLQVKVAITNPTTELKPEMLARVRFLAPAGSPGGTAQLLFAPQRLIQRDGDGRAVVWVADPRRNVAIRRQINPGEARHDGWIAVTSGLHPGELLIADPSQLREGSRIRIVADETEGGGGDGAD